MGGWPGAQGDTSSPLWSLAKIECVAADIRRGVTNNLHDAAVILRGMVSILKDVFDILHV